jgi:hypothetical protein
LKLIPTAHIRQPVGSECSCIYNVKFGIMIHAWLIWELEIEGIRSTVTTEGTMEPENVVINNTEKWHYGRSEKAI